MITWLMDPLLRSVTKLARKALGTGSRRVIREINQLWGPMKQGVDELLDQALSDFINDSFIFPYDDRDRWEYKGDSRDAFCVSADVLKQLLIARVISTGTRQPLPNPSPWFTLDAVGCTPQLQRDIISAIAHARIGGYLESRVGEKVGSAARDLVLVSLRREAYKPLPGLPLMARFAEIAERDKGNPKKTKLAFEGGQHFKNGKFDEQSMRQRLAGKHYP